MEKDLKKLKKERKNLAIRFLSFHFSFAHGFITFFTLSVDVTRHRSGLNAYCRRPLVLISSNRFPNQMNSPACMSVCLVCCGFDPFEAIIILPCAHTDGSSYTHQNAVTSSAFHIFTIQMNCSNFSKQKNKTEDNFKI